MTALYVMIPVAVIIVVIALFVFFWAVNNGQYDDMDSPAHSILFDDEDPMHHAGVEEAQHSHDDVTDRLDERDA